MKFLNLGILAHVDAGKTSLPERLLFSAGVIDAIGSVDDGSTQTDTLALERQRGITIKAAVVSFVVGDALCCTGDTLFKDAVGGGDPGLVRGSVMDTLMELPHTMRVLPGHTDETTIGREWDANPFVRYWRGVEPAGEEAGHVGGEPATLVVWSPDYDGKGKALVRFGDGREAIVGGSRVERS